MTAGMPAMTITFSIRKPGAAEILLSTSSAPAGMRVIRMRASFMTPPVCSSRACKNPDRAGMVIDRHAERLRDRVGGDVVMGRTDAAGGEHVGVAGAQRIERGDDLRLLVRHHPDFLEIDANAR